MGVRKKRTGGVGVGCVCGMGEAMTSVGRAGTTDLRESGCFAPKCEVDQKERQEFMGFQSPQRTCRLRLNSLDPQPARSFWAQEGGLSGTALKRRACSKQ